MNYVTVDIFSKNTVLAGFFPDNVHRGRRSVGIRVKNRFMVFYAKTLVILELHAVHTVFRFPYCTLYVYLHALHVSGGSPMTCQCHTMYTVQQYFVPNLVLRSAIQAGSD